MAKKRKALKVLRFENLKEVQVNRKALQLYKSYKSNKEDVEVIQNLLEELEDIEGWMIMDEEPKEKENDDGT